MTDSETKQQTQMGSPGHDPGIEPLKFKYLAVERAMGDLAQTLTVESVALLAKVDGAMARLQEEIWKGSEREAT